MKHKDMMRNPNQSRRTFAFVYCVLAMQLLVACNPPLHNPISSAECDQFLENSTREMLYTQLADPKQLAKSVAATYHVPLNAIRVYENLDQVPPMPDAELRWLGDPKSGNSNDYGIDITRGDLASYQIGYGSQPPTVNDILRCLGTPSAYFAWYGPGLGESGNGLAFWMFFPQHGVIAFSDQQADFADHAVADALIPLDVARLPISWIRFSHAATTDALLLERLIMDLKMDVHEEPGKTILAWYTNAIKPWPDEIRQLEYTAAPYPDIPLR